MNRFTLCKWVIYLPVKNMYIYSLLEDEDRIFIPIFMFTFCQQINQWLKKYRQILFHCALDPQHKTFQTYSNTVNRRFITMTHLTSAMRSFVDFSVVKTIRLHITELGSACNNSGHNSGWGHKNYTYWVKIQFSGALP